MPTRNNGNVLALFNHLKIKLRSPRWAGPDADFNLAVGEQDEKLLCDHVMNPNSNSWEPLIERSQDLAVAAARRQTRMSAERLFNALATATLRMVPVTAACAAAGLVVGGISMTGASGKVSFLVFQIAGDGVFISLLLTAVLAILLGMGMPTPSAYIMAAVLTAPTLINLGLSVLTAHMFLLFFAVLSAMTPPVAVAAFAASSLAEANPLKIAGRAVLLAIPAFVAPFIFAFRPQLLGQGAALEIALAIITASAGVAAISIAVAGYLRRPLNWYLRLLMLGGGIFLIVPGLITDIGGLGLCAVAIFISHQLRARSTVTEVNS